MDESGKDLTAFAVGGLVVLGMLIGYFYHEDRTNPAAQAGDPPAVQSTISRTSP